MAGAGRRDADVDVLLSLGTAAGKRGARVVCDVPAAARDLVAELPGDQGLIRFRAPSWTGDPVSSDGRLAALRELAAGQDADAVRVLVGWCVGGGRADTAAWARAHPAAALRWEATSVAGRKALGTLTGADVDAVCAAVLS